MGKVKKSTWYITAIVIPTVHRSSATQKQFKKGSVQSVQFLSPEYTGSSATRKQFKKESVQSVQFLSPEYTGSSVRSTLPPSIASSRTQDVQILFNKEKEIEEEKKIWNNKEREKEEEKQISFIKEREMEKGKRPGTKRKRRMKKTSQELRMLSRSLSDCKSLLINVMIQVSQFVSSSQLCH